MECVLWIISENPKEAYVHYAVASCIFHTGSHLQRDIIGRRFSVCCLQGPIIESFQLCILLCAYLSFNFEGNPTAYK